MGVRTCIELTAREPSSRFLPSRRRALRLLDDNSVEGRLKVLTELIFFWGRRLRVRSKEYGRRSEILRSLFGNKVHEYRC
jgi:hypothetical protein